MPMKKIFNTFKYGDIRTKMILIFTILAGIGTAALFVLTFITGQMAFFFGGVVCGFITISLAQTFAIKQDDIHIPPAYVVSGDIEAIASSDGAKMGKPTSTEEMIETKEENHQIHEKENVENHQVHEEETVENNDMSPEAEDFFRLFGDANYEETKIQTVAEEESEEKGSEPEELESKTVDNEIEEDTLKKPKTIFGKLFKKRNKKKTKPKKENRASEKFFPEDEEKELSHEEVVARYDRKIIKKVMHKYKVKRDHRMVLVDHCDKLKIKQTAAYIWVADKEFHLLLIDKEPRYYTLPIFSISEITYMKKVPANAQIDYGAFKGNSVVAGLFSEYLPDYTYSTVVDDMTSFKNLYGIGPGIYFTNKSAANLFDLLGVPFSVADKVTTSNKVNIFFKEAYKSNILLRDNVIDANAYADKISKILDDMAHSTVSYNEFKETLNLMIKNKLITEEFAQYYMGVRDKISR